MATSKLNKWLVTYNDEPMTKAQAMMLFRYIYKIKAIENGY